MVPKLKFVYRIERARFSKHSFGLELHIGFLASGFGASSTTMDVALLQSPDMDWGRRTVDEFLSLIPDVRRVGLATCILNLHSCAGRNMVEAVAS